MPLVPRNGGGGGGGGDLPFLQDQTDIECAIDALRCVEAGERSVLELIASGFAADDNDANSSDDPSEASEASVRARAGDDDDCPPLKVCTAAPDVTVVHQPGQFLLPHFNLDPSCRIGNMDETSSPEGSLDYEDIIATVVEHFDVESFEKMMRSDDSEFYINDITCNQEDLNSAFENAAAAAAGDSGAGCDEVCISIDDVDGDFLSRVCCTDPFLAEGGLCGLNRCHLMWKFIESGLIKYILDGGGGDNAEQQGDNDADMIAASRNMFEPRIPQMIYDCDFVMRDRFFYGVRPKGRCPGGCGNIGPCRRFADYFVDTIPKRSLKGACRREPNDHDLVVIDAHVAWSEIKLLLLYFYWTLERKLGDVSQLALGFRVPCNCCHCIGVLSKTARLKNIRDPRIKVGHKDAEQLLDKIFLQYFHLLDLAIGENCCCQSVVKSDTSDCIMPPVAVCSKNPDIPIVYVDLITGSVLSNESIGKHVDESTRSYYESTRASWIEFEKKTDDLSEFSCDNSPLTEAACKRCRCSCALPRFYTFKHIVYRITLIIDNFTRINESFLFYKMDDFFSALCVRYSSKLLALLDAKRDFTFLLELTRIIYIFKDADVILSSLLGPHRSRIFSLLFVVLPGKNFLNYIYKWADSPALDVFLQIFVSIIHNKLPDEWSKIFFSYLQVLPYIHEAEEWWAVGEQLVINRTYVEKDDELLRMYDKYHAISESFLRKDDFGQCLSDTPDDDDDDEISCIKKEKAACDEDNEKRTNSANEEFTFIRDMGWDDFEKLVVYAMITACAQGNIMFKEYLATKIDNALDDYRTKSFEESQRPTNVAPSLRQLMDFTMNVVNTLFAERCQRLQSGVREMQRNFDVVDMSHTVCYKLSKECRNEWLRGSTTHKFQLFGNGHLENKELVSDPSATDVNKRTSKTPDKCDSVKIEKKQQTRSNKKKSDKKNSSSDNCDISLVKSKANDELCIIDAEVAKKPCNVYQFGLAKDFVYNRKTNLIRLNGEGLNLQKWFLITAQLLSYSHRSRDECLMKINLNSGNKTDDESSDLSALFKSLNEYLNYKNVHEDIFPKKHYQYKVPFELCGKRSDLLRRGKIPRDVDSGGPPSYNSISDAITEEGYDLSLVDTKNCVECQISYWNTSLPEIFEDLFVLGRFETYFTKMEKREILREYLNVLSPLTKSRIFDNLCTCRNFNFESTENYHMWEPTLKDVDDEFGKLRIVAKNKKEFIQDIHIICFKLLTRNMFEYILSCDDSTDVKKKTETLGTTSKLREMYRKVNNGCCLDDLWQSIKERFPSWRVTALKIYLGILQMNKTKSDSDKCDAKTSNADSKVNGVCDDPVKKLAVKRTFANRFASNAKHPTDVEDDHESDDVQMSREDMWLQTITEFGKVDRVVKMRAAKSLSDYSNKKIMLIKNKVIGHKLDGIRTMLAIHHCEAPHKPAATKSESAKTDKPAPPSPDMEWNTTLFESTEKSCDGIKKTITISKRKLKYQNLAMSNVATETPRITQESIKITKKPTNVKNKPGCLNVPPTDRCAGGCKHDAGKCSLHPEQPHSGHQSPNDHLCNCCYCTVFGHAPPATAHVSRNFNETRERLRSILSKKKQNIKSTSAQTETSKNTKEQDIKDCKKNVQTHKDKSDAEKKQPPIECDKSTISILSSLDNIKEFKKQIAITPEELHKLKLKMISEAKMFNDKKKDVGECKNKTNLKAHVESVKSDLQSSVLKLNITLDEKKTPRNDAELPPTKKSDKKKSKGTTATVEVPDQPIESSKDAVESNLKAKAVQTENSKISNSAPKKTKENVENVSQKSSNKSGNSKKPTQPDTNEKISTTPDAVISEMSRDSSFCTSSVCSGCSESNAAGYKPLQEILDYIEGSSKSADKEKKVAKKARQKIKKLEVKLLKERDVLHENLISMAGETSRLHEEVVRLKKGLSSAYSRLPLGNNKGKQNDAGDAKSDLEDHDSVMQLRRAAQEASARVTKAVSLAEHAQSQLRYVESTLNLLSSSVTKASKRQPDDETESGQNKTKSNGQPNSSQDTQYSYNNDECELNKSDQNMVTIKRIILPYSEEPRVTFTPKLPDDILQTAKTENDSLSNQGDKKNQVKKAPLSWETTIAQINALAQSKKIKDTSIVKKKPEKNTEDSKQNLKTNNKKVLEVEDVSAKKLANQKIASVPNAKDTGKNVNKQLPEINKTSVTEDVTKKSKKKKGDELEVPTVDKNSVDKKNVKKGQPTKVITEPEPKGKNALKGKVTTSEPQAEIQKNTSAKKHNETVSNTIETQEKSKNKNDNSKKSKEKNAEKHNVKTNSKIEYNEAAKKSKAVSTNQNQQLQQNSNKAASKQAQQNQKTQSSASVQKAANNQTKTNQKGPQLNIVNSLSSAMDKIKLNDDTTIELASAAKKDLLNGSDSQSGKGPPVSSSIVEQLKSGVQFADLRLPPGITLTRVDPSKQQHFAPKPNIPLMSSSTPNAYRPTPPVPPPPAVIMVDTTKLHADRESKNAMNLEDAKKAGKSKKSKKKSKKTQNGQTNSQTGSQTHPNKGGDEPTKMVTLRNPMFHPTLVPTSVPTLQPTTKRSGDARGVPEPIPMPTNASSCQATITPTSNGMYTIRNPLMSIVHQQSMMAMNPMDSVSNPLLLMANQHLPGNAATTAPKAYPPSENGPDKNGVDGKKSKDNVANLTNRFSEQCNLDDKKKQRPVTDVTYSLFKQENDYPTRTTPSTSVDSLTTSNVPINPIGKPFSGTWKKNEVVEKKESETPSSVDPPRLYTPFGPTDADKSFGSTTYQPYLTNVPDAGNVWSYGIQGNKSLEGDCRNYYYSGVNSASRLNDVAMSNQKMDLSSQLNSSSVNCQGIGEAGNSTESPKSQQFVQNRPMSNAYHQYAYEQLQNSPYSKYWNSMPPPPSNQEYCGYYGKVSSPSSVIYQPMSNSSNSTFSGSSSLYDSMSNSSANSPATDYSFAPMHLHHGGVMKSAHHQQQHSMHGGVKMDMASMNHNVAYNNAVGGMTKESSVDRNKNPWSDRHHVYTNAFGAIGTVNSNESSSVKMNGGLKNGENDEYYLADNHHSVFAPDQTITNLNDLESSERDIECFKRFDYYFEPPKNKPKISLNVQDIAVQRQTSAKLSMNRNK